MKRILQIIEKASTAAAYASGILTLLIVLLIMVEIVLRSVFNTSTLISDEYSAYFFVGVILLSLAYTFRTDGHIRITLLISMLGRRGRFLMEVLATTVAIVIITYALYYSSVMVYDSWSLGMSADSISETPIYLSQLVIPVGLILLDFELVARLIRKFL